VIDLDSCPISAALEFRAKNGGVNGPPVTEVVAKKKGL